MGRLDDHANVVNRTGMKTDVSMTMLDRLVEQEVAVVHRQKGKDYQCPCRQTWRWVVVTIPWFMMMHCQKPVSNIIALAINSCVTTLSVPSVVLTPGKLSPYFDDVFC